MSFLYKERESICVSFIRFDMCFLYTDRSIFVSWKKSVSQRKIDLSISVSYIQIDGGIPCRQYGFLLLSSCSGDRNSPTSSCKKTLPVRAGWDKMEKFICGSVFCDSFPPLPINLKTKELTTLVRRMPSNKAICIRKLRQNTTNLTNLPYWPSSWLEAIATCKTFQRRVPARPVLRHVPN